MWVGWGRGGRGFWGWGRVGVRSVYWCRKSIPADAIWICAMGTNGTGGSNALNTERIYSQTSFIQRNLRVAR